MFIQFLLAIIAGTIAGTITGLIPGLHINMIAALLTASIVLLTQHIQLTTVAVFIFSMAITHTFIDAIPSTLLGAPNPDTVEMILPAHKMVLNGYGYEAVRLATMGATIGVIAGIFCVPVFIIIIEFIQSIIKPLIGWLLLIISLYFIITEPTINKKFWSAIIFAVSGVLGAFTLTFPNLNQPLLPMLSGLFGISTLLISIMDNPETPLQKRTESSRFKLTEWARTLTTAIAAGWIASFLPGLGTAQSTMAAKVALPKDPKLFIVAAGAINTLNYLFSLATWASIDKARNGAVVAIKEFITSSKQHLFLLTISAIITAAFATVATLLLARLCIELINRINYNAIATSIIIFLSLLTIIISKEIGILILLVSTAVGVLTQLLSVRKSAAMGCLVIPVIVFFIL